MIPHPNLNDYPPKLKTTQTKPFRTELLNAQDFLCPLTGSEIQLDEACLDHCHDQGYVRSVLPRNVNTLEGKIKNAFIRYGKKKCQESGISYADFLRNLADYVEQDWSMNPLHCTHLTPEEKKEKAKAKAKRKRAKLKK